MMRGNKGGAMPSKQITIGVQPAADMAELVIERQIDLNLSTIIEEPKPRAQSS
jgi:hypothetical protein